jgi:hypothetical protein
VSRLNTAIGVTGIKETTRALAAFDPALKKRLNKTIRTALADVQAGAQAKYPTGAWQIVISNKNMLGSIKTRAGSRGTTGSWADADGGVRAAIFEFAGSTQSGATPQARGLIKHLNEKYGGTGRFLWAAWDERGKKALETIRQGVLAAERDLQSKLDAAGEAY